MAGARSAGPAGVGDGGVAGQVARAWWHRRRADWEQERNQTFCICKRRERNREEHTCTSKMVDGGCYIARRRWPELDPRGRPEWETEARPDRVLAPGGAAAGRTGSRGGRCCLRRERGRPM